MNSAFVKIWGELVGAVSWDEGKGLASFEYAPEFKKLQWDLAPLKLPCACLLYTSPSPRDRTRSRMPSSA